ncbi:hypothetical protein [Falsiroseomonas sp. CW058]|uniref:hypothetical protein n=1 Tax=Falsiroseomonas sp. CW058 TaxID=3388664 RepID=UPI003D311206
MDLPPDDFVEVKATVRGVTFPMLVKRRADAKVMLVFGQSALSTRTDISLPVFHRWSWMADFPEATCVALSDPTLALDPGLLGGWFQGEPDHFYAETAAALLRGLAARLGIPPGCIVFYGSSAGGFTSIVMAGEIGASAVVEIPQIVMSDYHVASALRGLLRHCYGGLDLQEAKRRFGARMDITTRLRETKRLPDILYLQNLADKVHVERHMQPFLATIAQLWEEEPELRAKRLAVEFYSARAANGDGHAVAPKAFTVRALRRAMRDALAQG